MANIKKHTGNHPFGIKPAFELHSTRRLMRAIPGIGVLIKAFKYQQNNIYEKANLFNDGSRNRVCVMP